MTTSTRGLTASGVRRGRGLRFRVIAGFAGVSVATAVITAATTVVSVLVVLATRPIGTASLARRLAGDIRLLGVSDTDALWLLAGAATGLFVISVGGGWIFARRMLRPVQALAQAADRVAEGHLDGRLDPAGDDELADLAHSFNAMTVDLARSIDELRRHEAQAQRFAADVSHELRTPLAAMTAVMDILSDETDAMSPDAAKAAQLVIAEIGHLDQLISDLIEMSQFDAGTAVLKQEPISVASAVYASLRRRGWTDLVEVAVEPSLTAFLDRRRFDVILANLVGNAVRYGSPPIAVDVVADLAADSMWTLIMTVSDRGPGLPAAALPHLFERFYKASSARIRSEGSGLGLAIAAENARLHGGALTAQNRPGGGALFCLQLPMSALESAEDVSS